MSTTEHINRNPDDIIHEMGGCGRFQIRMAVYVHLAKTVICWSSMVMIFATATPKWWCTDGYVDGNMTDHKNISAKSCLNENGTRCSSFEFKSDMQTVVSEWELICDRAWIPSTIMTIQVLFQLFGNFFAGQLADTIGRKIPFFASIFIIIGFNIICYFSVSWVMFTVSRVFIGLGCGLFLTIQYCYLSEFSLARWRSWLIGFPSWPIQTCILALVLWLLQDWRKAHLVTALIGLPFIVAIWFLPESFRWYYGHDRIEEAEQVIKAVSKVNGRPTPDMEFMEKLQVSTKDKKYTIFDIFRTRFLIKVSLLLALNWLALGLATYGISFGIQNLSWNIYLNLFLFNLVNIPAKGLSVWIQNRFGRRIACIICYSITSVSALVCGCVQFIDTDKKGAITNGFAIVANLGMAMAWGPVQTLTIETFPTVIRNIGFGFCSVLTRVGGALGPQLVYLDTFIPGILFFICGGICTLCVFGTLGIPETKDSNLNDKIIEKKNVKKLNDIQTLR